MEGRGAGEEGACAILGACGAGPDGRACRAERGLKLVPSAGRPMPALWSPAFCAEGPRVLMGLKLLGRGALPKMFGPPKLPPRH